MATPSSARPKGPAALLLSKLLDAEDEQQQVLTPYTEDVPEIIQIEEESEDEDMPGTPSGSNVFTRSQVFVVDSISKAMQGFRPSVMLEGCLAELSSTSDGFALLPVGTDQQLSFKYEPPSPKFCRKRPHCVSYRLQLLQGSQFLYSLRGLPTVLRCQKNARALEWGPVHVVFSYAADLELFLSTIKYVEASEVGTSSSGGMEMASPVGPRASLVSTSRRQLNSSEGGVGSMLWGTDAARLWMREDRVPGGVEPKGAAAGGSAVGPLPTLLRRVREQPVLASAAAAAVAAVAVVAAYVLSGRRSGR